MQQIILDTFGGLRAQKAAKRAHMQNFCFICGCDRFTFETKAEGFERHIRHDHWMWTYFALIVHLFEKDPSTYNGWESSVAKKIKENDASFFPQNTALVLQAAEEAGSETMALMTERLGSLEQQVEQVRKMLTPVLGKEGGSRRSETKASANWNAALKGVLGKRQ